MNNYDELFEKFNGNVTPDQATEISDGMQREKTSGEYYLVKAFIHDIHGREKIAQICYEKADKLGFRDSQKLSWYKYYGSTLRWNEKFKESNEILTKGLEEFKDDNTLKGFLVVNKYKEKLISEEEARKELAIFLPTVKDEFWI